MPIASFVSSLPEPYHASKNRPLEIKEWLHYLQNAPRAMR
jgi:hypothetical protein